MKCNMCGKEVSRIDRYCNNCGENNENYVEPVVVRPRNQEIVRQSRGTYENDQKVSYDSQQQTQQPINIHLHQPQVEGSTVGWGFLSYFFPLVGIILYFIWKNDKPRAAKTCLTWGLISIGISFFLGFISAFA